jgi:hypothetical protein
MRKMAYICDSCGTWIDDPHKAEVKEFCFLYCIIGALRAKRKITIDLCDLCFKGLKTIAEKKMEVRE